MSDHEEELSLEDYLALIRLEKVYFVVKRREFEALDKEIQRAGTGQQQLRAVETLANNYHKKEREVLLFTDESFYYGGLPKLEAAGKGKSTELMPYIVSPLLFLAGFEGIECSAVTIDFGQGHQVSIDDAEFTRLRRLPVSDRIASFKKIFILQDIEGFAISMDIDGEDYAIAFFKESDGFTTLEGMEEGVTLGANRPKMLAAEMLKTDFNGLVFNPASATQTILDREDLKIVLEIAEQNTVVGSLLKSITGR